MGQVSLIDTAGLRHYLLDKTQHLIGGFGKSVGEPPGETRQTACVLMKSPADQTYRSVSFLPGSGCPRAGKRAGTRRCRPGFVCWSGLTGEREEAAVVARARALGEGNV